MNIICVSSSLRHVTIIPYHASLSFHQCIFMHVHYFSSVISFFDIFICYACISIMYNMSSFLPSTSFFFFCVCVQVYHGFDTKGSTGGVPCWKAMSAFSIVAEWEAVEWPSLLSFTVTIYRTQFETAEWKSALLRWQVAFTKRVWKFLCHTDWYQKNE